MVTDVDLTQLPPRAGSRPHATDRLPHSQIDQQPADGHDLDAILDEASGWPHVDEQPSRISVEGSRGLVVATDAATGPADAFMIDREFCHGHADGDFSLHVTLPVELAKAAELAGWAEPHYLVQSGQAPPTVVMLYAPRDDAERDVILKLVRASYEYALATNEKVDA